jgi:outer membrane receptor protein involved in Fe transport
LLLSASYYSAIFGPPNLSAALSTFPTTWTFTDGLFSDMGGSDNAYPQGRKVRQWQLIDDYSITHGNHNIKFGANVRKNFVATYAYGSNTSGLYTFNSMTDFVNGNLANGSTYAQAFAGIGAENLTMYSAGFYGQDEWKVRPNLTLTLALRLDRNSNIKCGVGCFNELAGQPFGQLAHSATIPYNAAIKTGLTEAFPSVEPIVPEPRVGMAWNVTKNTVVRGGFGIFSDLYQGLIADRLITNSPAVA